MAVLGPSEEERLAMCAWLTANGVDPETVPLRSAVSIVEVGGQWHIQYTEFVRDEETGKILADGEGYGRTRGVRVPCIEKPPAWLNVPGARP